MSIDNFADSGINIKDLMTNEPPKTEGKWFDPRRDIPEENWRGIMDRLGSAATPNNFLEFLELGNSVKTMDPEKNVDQFASAAIKNEIQEQLKKDWGREKSEPGAARTLFRDLTYTATLFPDIPNDELINQEQKVLLKTKVQNVINTALTSDPELNYQALEGLATIKRFDPELLSGIEHVDEIIDLAKAYCEDMLSKFDQEDGYNEYTESFLEYASQLKVLSPEKFKQLKITEVHWKNAKTYLEEEFTEEYMGDPYYHYANAALKLSIIAASDIKFDRGSLILSFDDKQTDFTDKIPPPQSRKF